MKQFYGLFVLAVTLTACQPRDPALTTPPKSYPAQAPIAPLNRPVSQVSTPGLKEQQVDSRVDILLVLDDSASMQAHTQNLSRNINQFVNAFAKNKSIDFHIGFTHVYDRLRYGPIVPDVCGAQTSTPLRVNWQIPGSLEPFVGPTNLMPQNGRRYLTRDDDFVTLLRTTLDPDSNPIMIKNYVDPNPKNPSLCPEGPEFEESTTPILGALEAPVTSASTNAGFRRPGAFFVAIIVSDAKDEYIVNDNGSIPKDPSRPNTDAAQNHPRITANDFVQRVFADTVDANGKRRFRIFAAVISPGTVITGSDSSGACKPDPAFSDSNHPRKDGTDHYLWTDGRRVQEGENPLVEIARLTEDANSPRDGQVLSLCSNSYGAALANFGIQVQKDALSDLTIELPDRPQVFGAPDSSSDSTYSADLQTYNTKRMHVYIGAVELSEGTQWNYNPQNATVIVYGQKIDWSKYPNEKVRVTYTPANAAAPTTQPWGN